MAQTATQQRRLWLRKYRGSQFGQLAQAVAHAPRMGMQPPHPTSAMNSRRVIRPPLAAEEITIRYQLSADAASICCIAIGAHGRRLLWVKSAVTQWSGFEVKRPWIDHAMCKECQERS